MMYVSNDNCHDSHHLMEKTVLAVGHYCSTCKIVWRTRYFLLSDTINVTQWISNKANSITAVPQKRRPPMVAHNLILQGLF